SVEGLLYRIINDKPQPFDFEDALNHGINFLREAGDGGAIICGTAESTGFDGTLSPFCWSTDAYIEFALEGSERKADVFKEVVTTLEGYRGLLESIQEGHIPEDTSEVTKVYSFFRTLADALMKQADPTTRTYSHEAR
ncbi:unnamed protein product, partial [marine sediment metagenome]